MRAGFFETEVTPAVGMEKPGGYHKAFHRAYHDPLKVRAGVFDDGQKRVALVGIDTLGITAEVVAAARAGIHKHCGIKGNHVLIGASHTHSGGPLPKLLAEDVQDAPPLIRELVVNHSVIGDALYRDWVIRQIVTAVCEADRRQEKALLSVGRGCAEGVAFNRRFRMKNGRVYTHPGKGNPDIVEPAGPVDPEVGVLAAWRPEGKLLGCVVNFACHGTTFGGAASADWIHYLARTIKGVMGKQAVPVFLNGACGDVTQVDNLSTRTRKSREDWARLVGVTVGAEALKVMVKAAKGRMHPVTATTKMLKLKHRRPSAESLRKCRRLVRAGLKKKKKTNDWLFAKERLILDYLLKEEPVATLETQAIQIGPAVYLANPGECFCQLGLDIKRGSPFPFTFVVELANGTAGYIPTAADLAATGGGYETILTSYSNLEPLADTKIVTACLQLARRLRPSPPPRLPRVEATGRPWDYGIRGPDLE